MIHLQVFSKGLNVSLWSRRQPHTCDWRRKVDAYCHRKVHHGTLLLKERKRVGWATSLWNNKQFLANILVFGLGWVWALFTREEGAGEAYYSFLLGKMWPTVAYVGHYLLVLIFFLVLIFPCSFRRGCRFFFIVLVCSGFRFAWSPQTVSRFNMTVQSDKGLLLSCCVK